MNPEPSFVPIRALQTARLAAVIMLLAPGLAPGDQLPDAEPLVVPLSIVVNDTHEWVAGTADPSAQVSIELTNNVGALKEQATVTVDGTGNFLTLWEDWTSGEPNIQPGDYVYATVPGDSADVSPVGLLIADPEYPSLDWVPGSSLDHLQAASVSHRIAIGPHAGRKALTLYSVPPLDEAPNNPLLAQLAGFSLHAATVCEAHQRSRLDRLCRYNTRPPA